MSSKPVEELMNLAHRLHQAGIEQVPGEVCLAVRLDSKTMLTAPLGLDLAHYTELKTVPLSLAPLQYLVDNRPNAKSFQVRDALREAGLLPGVQVHPMVLAFSMLLDLPGLNAVAYACPRNILGLVCSNRSEPFALARYFTSQISSCGPRSIHVPLLPSGVAMAVDLRHRIENYINQYGESPRSFLLAQHGVLGCGMGAAAAAASVVAMEKAAGVYLAAQILGGAISLPDSYLHPDGDTTESP